MFSLFPDNTSETYSAIIFFIFSFKQRGHRQHCDSWKGMMGGSSLHPQEVWVCAPQRKDAPHSGHSFMVRTTVLNRVSGNSRVWPKFAPSQTQPAPSRAFL